MNSKELGDSIGRMNAELLHSSELLRADIASDLSAVGMPSDYPDSEMWTAWANSLSTTDPEFAEELVRGMIARQQHTE